ncbi:MAG: hypothetical protein AB9846_17965 [Tenuifilaceae bacterium]
MKNIQDDFEKEFPCNEFPEEPSAFSEALEDAIYTSTLDYPETKHTPLEDIL